MMGDSDRVLECTTSDFQGLITVLNPGSSWTARWLHIGELTRPWTLCSFLHLQSEANIAACSYLGHLACYGDTSQACHRQLQEIFAFEHQYGALPGLVKAVAYR